MPRTATFDAQLLAAIRREVARLQAADLRNLPPDRHAAGEIREAVRDAQAGIVAADFSALFGRVLSGAELKACQRAVIRLESAERLRRLRRGYCGARMTHLQLVEK
jgi:hypothetical protein